jgi:hypothetical protein
MNAAHAYRLQLSATKAEKLDALVENIILHFAMMDSTPPTDTGTSAMVRRRRRFRPIVPTSACTDHQCTHAQYR